MVVFGRSIGSIYAIEFAARYPNIAGLVLESGIADVLERILLRATPSELGGTSEEMAEVFGRLFDHERKLRDYPGKTLVLHAKGDSLVDKTHAERNARWAGEEGGDVRLVLLDRGDHNTIFGANEREYVREIGAFLDRARSEASSK
jgi:pimeloyl-ACP methyl ester carboxylesterase